MTTVFIYFFTAKDLASSSQVVFYYVAYSKD